MLLALFGLALMVPGLPGVAMAGSRQPAGLPPEFLAIARQVAGDGLPHCRAYQTDGQAGPCLPRFLIERGHAVNGWSSGGLIAFSEGSTRRLNPNEFALLAGHEIAHWYLGHRESTAANELEADRMGAELACRAGFDVVSGLSLFRHLRPGGVHATANVRLQAAQGSACLAQTMARRETESARG